MCVCVCRVTRWVPEWARACARPYMATIIDVHCLVLWAECSHVSPIELCHAVHFDAPTCPTPSLVSLRLCLVSTCYCHISLSNLTQLGHPGIAYQFKFATSVTLTVTHAIRRSLN